MLEPLEQRRLLSTGTLTLANTTPSTTASATSGAKLDLTDNKLIVTSGGSTWTGTSSITSLIQAGRGNGGGNGLGVATVGDLGSSIIFGGQTLNPSDTLVMYTYAGDANLDGIPDGPSEFFGSAKNDRIYVTQLNGIVTVNVNGFTTPADATQLRIFANAGDDYISIDLPSYINAHVTVYGAAGNDTIICGNESDRVFAGDGNDIVVGNDGKDTIYGEAGDDSIRGGGSNDLILGGDGNDTLRGDAGNDNISGGANSDRLRGSLGNDTLDGGGGRDLLAGEAGDDELLGGNGPDFLDGGAGADTLRGGLDFDQVEGGDSLNDDLDPAEVAGGEAIHLTDAAATTIDPGTLTLITNTTNLPTRPIVINGGILRVTSSAAHLAPRTVTVASGGNFQLDADAFDYSNGTIHVQPGGVIEFLNPVAVLTVGALQLDAGSFVTFSAGAAGHDEIHVVNPDALDARGAWLKVRPQGTVPSGYYNLIEYAGLPSHEDVTLVDIPKLSSGLMIDATHVTLFVTHG